MLRSDYELLKWRAFRAPREVLSFMVYTGPVVNYLTPTCAVLVVDRSSNFPTIEWHFKPRVAGAPKSRTYIPDFKSILYVFPENLTTLIKSDKNHSSVIKYSPPFESTASYYFQLKGNWGRNEITITFIVWDCVSLWPVVTTFVPEACNEIEIKGEEE